MVVDGGEGTNERTERMGSGIDGGEAVSWVLEVEDSPS